MNLENIQSRMQDIEQMRHISRENEALIMNHKGRTGTSYVDTDSSMSSLSFRFFLAAAILAFLIYADYRQLPGSGQLLDRAAEAISYNINSEDMENLQEVWYTITDTLSLQKLTGQQPAAVDK